MKYPLFYRCEVYVRPVHSPTSGKARDAEVYWASVERGPIVSELNRQEFNDHAAIDGGSSVAWRKISELAFTRLKVSHGTESLHSFGALYAPIAPEHAKTMQCAGEADGVAVYISTEKLNLGGPMGP